MDIELISVEADLLLAADSDRQAAYVMEKCAQLGAPVVSRMNVTMEEYTSDRNHCSRHGSVLL